MTKKALLHVDLQRDFFDEGALESKGSISIINKVNQLTAHAGIYDHEWITVFSGDMHPRETKHFDKWPVHCVENTRGAEFHPHIFVPDWAIGLHKGLGAEDDGYSPFDTKNVRIVLPLGRQGHYLNQKLGLFLRSLGVKEVYVDGLTLPYCPTAAAIGARGWGLKTYLIEDTTAALDPDNKETAIQELRDAGIVIITSNEILK